MLSGLGTGISLKKYPIPKGKDRNKIGDYGQKLKNLADKNLPWYKQRQFKGQGYEKFYKSGCSCPNIGWGNAVMTITSFGRISAALSAEISVPISWKIGTSFTWNNLSTKFEARLGIDPSIKAELGIGGDVALTWNKFIE